MIEGTYYSNAIIAIMCIVVLVVLTFVYVSDDFNVGEAYQTAESCTIKQISISAPGELVSCETVCNNCQFAQVTKLEGETIKFSGLSTCSDSYTVTDGYLHIRECVCCD